MAVISEFRGQYRFLSNFWPALVHLDGEPYSTVEHAYQAAKTLRIEHRKRIQRAQTPGQAKALGRSTVFLRSNWHEIKYGVMFDLVLEKFSVHRDLRERLIATSEYELVEGNTWGDTYWGVCRGVGENNLGKILMTVRGIVSKTCHLGGSKKSGP